jgi:hypothetical protein
MKIRLGFVSNSSSSSFLIYGMELDEEELLELASKINPEIDPEFYDEDILDDVLDVLYEKTDELKLDFKNVCGISFYIGKSWDEVKDDETGKQFKESVEKILREEFKISGQCDTYKEAWRDG